MLRLPSYLIATTRDPDGCPMASSLLVVETLRLYGAAFWSGSSLTIVTMPDDLATTDWGSLWQQWSGIRQDPKLLVYPGSIADSVGASSPQQTLADIAADWRIPVLLTVALDRWTKAQIRAYQALLQQAGAQCQGILLLTDTVAFGQTDDISADMSAPILGHLNLSDISAEGLLAQAKGWNWEGLTLTRSPRPDKVMPI